MRGRWVAALTVLVALAGCGSAGSPARTSDLTTSGPMTFSPAPTDASTPAATASTPPPAYSTAATRRSTSARRTTASVPPVSTAARRAGLRDVRSIVPDAVLDLRYATTHNFTHVRLYPADARCLVHSSMAPGLRTAAAALRKRHLRIVFWDCYRPHPVQVRMYKVVSNPNWVAKPGRNARSHEAGRSVDITLTRASCADPRGCLLRMGTGFDNFTPRAYAFATNGVTATAERDRALLRKAMHAGGLTVYSGEWWHFDGPGAGTPRPHLKVSL